MDFSIDELDRIHSPSLVKIISSIKYLYYSQLFSAKICLIFSVTYTVASLIVFKGSCTSSLPTKCLLTDINISNFHFFIHVVHVTNQQWEVLCLIFPNFCLKSCGHCVVRKKQLYYSKCDKLLFWTLIFLCFLYSGIVLTGILPNFVRF